MSSAECGGVLFKLSLVPSGKRVLELCGELTYLCYFSWYALTLFIMDDRVFLEIFGLEE